MSTCFRGGAASSVVDGAVSVIAKEGERGGRAAPNRRGAKVKEAGVRNMLL